MEAKSQASTAFKFVRGCLEPLELDVQIDPPAGSVEFSAIPDTGR